MLAPYVAYEAALALVNSEHPDISALGMALTASSVIGMPLLRAQSSESPGLSSREQLTARGPRTFCAPIWRRSSPDLLETRFSDGGGWIRSQFPELRFG